MWQLKRRILSLIINISNILQSHIDKEEFLIFRESTLKHHVAENNQLQITIGVAIDTRILFDSSLESVMFYN